jgi:gas vesicle protein
MADNDNGMAFVSGFLLGGLVGAAIGLLLAPKSGAETRAGIAEHSDEWRHRAEDIAGQISHNISPAIDNLRHQVAPAVDAVRGKMGMEAPAPPAEPEMASANGAEPAADDTGSEEEAPEAAPAAKAS